MKIGIVTFHRAINYGAALQAWALRKYLNSIGHEAALVDYDFEFERNGRRSIRPIYQPRRYLGRFKRGMLALPFLRFRGNHLGIKGRPCTHLDQLSMRYSNFEAFLCGSDQVWNPDYIATPDDEKVSWLQFTPPTAIRAAYAASFGTDSLPDDFKTRWARYTDVFQAIGLREKSGVAVAAKLGRHDAIVVPDPTLLIAPAAFTSIEASIRLPSGGYVFSFRLAEPAVDDVADQLCRIEKCRKISAGVFDLNWFLRGGHHGPPGWLAAIKNSSFVVTDSFHCLVFCLIYHRDFLLIPRTGHHSSRNVRVFDLLQEAGLMHRVAQEASPSILDAATHQPIDWEDVDRKLAAFRSKGQSFLDSILGITR